MQDLSLHCNEEESCDISAKVACIPVTVVSNHAEKSRGAPTGSLYSAETSVERRWAEPS